MCIRDSLVQSGLPVLASELGDRVAFQEALGFGQGVTTYAPVSYTHLTLPTSDLV